MAEKVADGDAEISPATVQVVAAEESAPPAKQPFPWKILRVLYFVIFSDAMAGQIIVRCNA